MNNVALENACKKYDIEKLLSVLSAKQKEIVILRFGLNGDEMSTYEEIAKEYGFSGVRARQITEKAITKIRLKFKKRLSELKEYMVL